MMAQTLPPLDARTQSLIVPLALIHCEISGDVAVSLGMPDAVVTLSLIHIWRGQGAKVGNDVTYESAIEETRGRAKPHQAAGVEAFSQGRKPRRKRDAAGMK